MYTNSTFYPTPQHVADLMLSKLNKEAFKGYVLEPSAGQGDLAEAIRKKICSNYGKYYTTEDTFKERIHCLEIDPDLQAILVGKKYPLVGYDFLKYNPKEQYSAIIMNPPFNAGAKHLLHAWGILNHGEIICILNARTIEHDYTREREELNIIIEKYGTYENIGNVFSSGAKRSTDANIGLIHLKKHEKNLHFNLFDADDFTKETNQNIEYEQKNELTTKDVIKTSVLTYNKACEHLKDVLLHMQKFSYYMRMITSDCSYAGEYDENIDRKMKKFVESTLRASFSEQSQQIWYNELLKSIKSHAWGGIFIKTNVRNLMTETAKKEFDKITGGQSSFSFDEENIYMLLNMLQSNKDNILTQCVLEAFDLMTKYYDENREKVEGWKTNDSYKVGMKFILPYMTSHSWSVSTKLDDIDRAIAFLDGKKLDDLGDESLSKKLNALLIEKTGIPIWGKWHDTYYFEIRPYKKGTLHFKFKDRLLWEHFNLVAADGRNWLPDDLKSKAKEARKRNRFADKFGLLESKQEIK